MRLPDFMVFGESLPRSARKSFIVELDKNSIGRIYIASWITLIVYLLLLYVDFKRSYSTDYDHKVFTLLNYVHISGILFIFIIIPILFFRKKVVESRLNRGLIIYCFLAILVITVLSNAVLAFYGTGSLSVYFGFIILSNWALQMNYFQRILFNLLSLLIVSYLVLWPFEDLFIIEIQGDESVFFTLRMFEVTFFTVILFAISVSDINLLKAKFLASLELASEKQRIEKLEQLKSRLYTNIAHEFRSPLTVIAGTTDQLMKEDGPDLQKVKTIHRNTARMLNLINQLLDLRKLEYGALTVKLVHGDIVPYLKYIEDCFSSHAEAQGIRMHFLIEQSSINMDYDPDLALNIASNLIANAIKFTPAGGDIYITVRRLEDAEDPTFELRVKDTGAGIPEKDLPHIFDQFYQSEENRVGTGTGTGIGLAMVYELTKLMRGSIEVKSQEGVGTEFILRFPIQNNPDVPNVDFLKASVQTIVESYLVEDAPEPSAKGTDHFKVRELPSILVVDDNEDVLELIYSNLNLSFNVIKARDGEEGLRLAREFSPDVVVSDIIMPKKDGLELCRELNTDTATSHIPVILLTAKADVEDKIEGLESGAVDYLAKPFSHKELSTKLHNLIDLRKIWQERYQSVDPDFQAHPGNREDKFISDVRELVTSRIDDTELNVTYLCKSLGMSRTQLHNKLKALTGKSATMFIRDIRLSKACSLLKQGDLNVSEVAYSVGFADPSYFTRVFVETYGMTPSQYA